MAKYRKKFKFNNVRQLCVFDVILFYTCEKARHVNNQRKTLHV